MNRRSRFALALVAVAALVLPSPVFAAAQPTAEGSAGATYDTPAPPDQGSDRETEPTPRPTPRPQPTPAPALSALPIAPDREGLTIGYSGSSIMRQAPLLVAELAGYFDAVGLTQVTIARSPDVLGDVLSGDLDVALLDVEEAYAAVVENPALQAIAGYRNYQGDTYGGDVLVAAPGLVANEPATVIAALAAYIAALQDFSEADTAGGTLELLQETDLRISQNLLDDWPGAVSIFAPFDGGFGSLGEDGGLGELNTLLTDDEGNEPDLDAFIASHTLNIAQSLSQLDANPVSELAEPPGISDVVVGLPGGADAPGPITVAAQAGYFEEAGFGSVEIMDVEEPLLGLLQGELDFGVLDALDAADGAAQGLPLAALAGHQNYSADGTYGGDLLAVSADLLAEERSTASAFLIGYLRGLQDLRDEAALAPHDGGFGSRDEGGGLGELQAYLQAALGQDIDLGSLLRTEPLEYAQAWWGLPANPADPVNPVTDTEGE